MFWSPCLDDGVHLSTPNPQTVAKVAPPHQRMPEVRMWNWFYVMRLFLLHIVLSSVFLSFYDIPSSSAPRPLCSLLSVTVTLQLILFPSVLSLPTVLLCPPVISRQLCSDSLWSLAIALHQESCFQVCAQIHRTCDDLVSIFFLQQVRKALPKMFLYNSKR